MIQALRPLLIRGLALIGPWILDRLPGWIGRSRKNRGGTSHRSRISPRGAAIPRGVGTRKKRLKTCFQDGRPVEVMITSGRDQIVIRTFREFDFVRSLPENEIGARLNNGQIFFFTDYRHFSADIVQFTKLIDNVIFTPRALGASQTPAAGAKKKRRRRR